jgi:MFS family permease
LNPRQHFPFELLSAVIDINLFYFILNMSLNTKIKNYILSPITFFASFYAYQVILAPLVYLQLVPELVYEDVYIQGFLISMLFFGAIYFGWRLSPIFGKKSSSFLLNHLCLKYTIDSKKDWRRGVSICFFVLFLVSFVLLAYFSGAGMLWITNSRISYQLSRNGVGVLYAAAATFLKLSYLVIIFKHRESKFSLLDMAIKTISFMFIANFLGSKAIMLGLLIIALVYYNYFISAIKLPILLAFFVLILILFSILQIWQGTSYNVTETLLYADYFHNTCEFIRRFNEFEFQWGKTFISNWWSIVPRGLYPDKPYEYGQLLINQILFPGLAEQSFTPGLLPWAAYYLDFGIFGVFIFGVFQGLLMGWSHEYFLNKNCSITGFIVLIQIGGITEIFSFIPLPIFLFFTLPIISLFFYSFNGLIKLGKRQNIQFNNFKH